MCTKLVRVIQVCFNTISFGLKCLKPGESLLYIVQFALFQFVMMNIN